MCSENVSSIGLDQLMQNDTNDDCSVHKIRYLTLIPIKRTD